MYTDTKKTEGFIETLRSSATLLVRTLDRLHFDYSETAARDLRERVELLAELDRLENKEAPIPMDYLRQRVRLLKAHAELRTYGVANEMSNAALAKRIALLKELRTVENEATRFGFAESRIEQRIQAIRELKNRQEEKERKANLRATTEARRDFEEDGEGDQIAA